MMNTAFRRETVNAVYLALQTSKVDDLFKLAREIPIQGLSVTMPLKQDVMPLLERTDPLSAKIGAVNTITRLPDGKFYGFNTDVAGIVGPLERRLSLRDAKVLVLGAGGAARAAVFGCRDKGAEVWILNRTTETAHKLARQSGAKTMRRDQLAKTHFDVIINATSVGMASTSGKNAPAAILQPAEINARLVFDLVYNPIETPLLRMARQKGIPVITGVEMFVQQGARQFEIWTGKPAPEEEMLRVVLHSLRQNAEGAESTLPVGKVEILPPPQAAQPEPAPVVKEEPRVTTIIKQAPVKQAAVKPAPAKPPLPVTKVAPAKHPPVKVAVKVTAKVTSRAPAKAVAKKLAPAKKAVAKKPAAKPVRKPVKKVVATKKKSKTGSRK
jgi:3-dehydroquinate dehydratase/shikimate dehydrogenase